MKTIFSILLTASICLCNAQDLQSSLPTLHLALKQREPNWRSEIQKTYPSGNPLTILFYQPMADGTEAPVKQIILYENSVVQTEMDVILHNGSIVPHGVKVDFTPQNAPAKVCVYEFGALQGEARQLYPNGKVMVSENYSKGKRDGKIKAFYEEGQLKEEGQFVDGEPVGDFIQYFQDGTKMSLRFYENGKIHGKVTEWYPNGSVRVERLYSHGLLHGDGVNPALIAYDEDKQIQEVVDFRDGKATGPNIRYYPNGKESYHVQYKNGLKIGKESFFAKDGSYLGEGQYVDGKAVGKHWRKFENGKKAFEAEFDKEGNACKPIVEWSENGNKLREYSLRNEKLEGPYTEWYPDGTLKFEYNYAAGQFEGAQKEYFPSGELKVCSNYEAGKRHGLYEEWAENGILLQKYTFVHDLKEGKGAEWYSNGNTKLDVNFSSNYPDGMQTEWYENGELKQRFEFASGLKEGWHRGWNESGDLIFEARFHNDLPVGPMLTWWNKDQIHMRFFFENGKKEGKQEWYHSNGALERIAFYHEDVQEGDLTSWYADGSLQSIQHFKAGKPVGEHREFFPKKDPEQTDEQRLARIFHYDENGALHGSQTTFYQNNHQTQTVAFYFHGTLDGMKKMWDGQGNLVEEGTYALGKLNGLYFQKTADGREVVYHFKDNLKNGLYQLYGLSNEGKKTLLVEANYENDQLHGIATEFNPATEKKASVTPYVAGVKEGIAYLYDQDGKLTASVELSNNLKNGLAIQYFPNGSVFRETSFVNDLREGEEKTYHEDESLASIFRYHNDALEGLAQSWNPEGVLVFEAEYEKGMKHGLFKKYYDDGNPYIVQNFQFDQPHGEKKKFDRSGMMTVSHYDEGKLLKGIR